MSEENLCNNKYKIFCDMDGVLVDIYQGESNAILNEAPDGASDHQFPCGSSTHPLGQPVADKYWD